MYMCIIIPHAKYMYMGAYRLANLICNILTMAKRCKADVGIMGHLRLILNFSVP